VRRAVVVVLVAASCGLPDPAEFARGSGLGHEPDGGTSGGSDGGSSGNGPNGVDAGDSGGPLLPGCAGHPTAIFCADFDTDPYDNGFDTNSANGISSDTKTAVSPPRSLVATLPSRGDGMPNSFLEHFLDPGVTSFRLSWSAKLEDSGAQSAVDFGVSLSRNTPTYHSLQVRYVHAAGDSPMLQLFEYANAQGNDPQVVDFNDFTVLPRVGQFQRFEMRMTQSASASLVTLLLDGVTIFTDHPLTFYRATGATRIMAGIGGSDGPGDPVVVHVDDVVVEPP
jgi:hypothetical protein